MDALNRDQMAALYKVSAVNRRDHIMIRLAYEHAGRATEVCSLRARDFDVSSDAIYLRLMRLKGSKATIQPLMPETAALVREWLADKGQNEYLFTGKAHGHISRMQFYRVFRRYCALTGIIPVHLRHPHAAKHALATHVINVIGIQATRQYCGHRSISSTQVYLHSSDQQASAAVHAVLGGAALAVTL